jgi:hypothetical protein
MDHIFSPSLLTPKMLMAKINHIQHCGNHPVRAIIGPLSIWCSDYNWLNGFNYPFPKTNLN